MFVRISGSPFFDTMRSLEGSVNRDADSSSRKSAFPVDVTESENHFELVAELPGITKEDMSISVENGMLIVRGERKHYGFPEGTKVLRHETRTNPIARSFELPEEVDAGRIAAELKDGILRIQLPKAEQARPREIKIR